ncbi:DUF5335 family protein [Pseudonocardia acidicola]|uniref:DUF5335 family protein n=1 Tax=Pseudonocardia acidicola TaxID=2724939 RepID=A0ABX1S9E7_9PSEU|nr:DUF5335 family protein [Pseudonocardia acidicola]NMH97502.1 DUF5335 family protein [Pseudonocardia acidicola]
MTQPDTKVDKDDWRRVLDQLTAEHEGDYITIELNAPEIGHEHEAEQKPFAYATYDPKDDVVIVAVGQDDPEEPVLRHMVWHPTEVIAALDSDSPPAFEVVEPDGTTTLVTFYPQHVMA